MDEKTIVASIFGIVGALIFLTLAARSGVLPFALMGGGLASGAVFYLSRKLRIALVVGGAVALVVSAIGVGLLLGGR